MRHLRTIRAVIAVTVTAGILTACSTTPAPPKPKPPVSYYVALGDSLSLGVQPNADGVTVPTEQGYPDQLYATLHRNRPGLRLVHLGCSGETTKTMLNGGIWQPPGYLESPPFNQDDAERRDLPVSGGLAAGCRYRVPPRPSRSCIPGDHRHRRQRPAGLRPEQRHCADLRLHHRHAGGRDRK